MIHAEKILLLLPFNTNKMNNPHHLLCTHISPFNLDCSITYGQAAGTHYLIRKLVYFLIGIIPAFYCLRFINVFKQKRLGTKNKEVLSVAERANYFTLCIIFCSTIAVIDPQYYDGTIPRVLLSGFKKSCSFFGSMILINLVRSWVTISDGGKTQQLPQWFKLTARFFYVWIFMGEVCLSMAEEVIGEGAGYGGFNGTINGIKSLAVCVPWIFYMIILLHYATKIANSLKNGGVGGEAATQGLIKYCKITIFCLFLGKTQAHNKNININYCTR